MVSGQLPAGLGQRQALAGMVVFDLQRRELFALLDIDEAGAADEGLQRHHRFQRRGDDHLEAEALEDAHGKLGELVVCLAEGLVEDDRRIERQPAVAAAELVAGRAARRPGQARQVVASFSHWPPDLPAPER
jgi:hypothetical protein